MEEQKQVSIDANLEFLEGQDEAFAAASLNPYFQWAKILVCDDQPNANKQRIPDDEFENLIRTGTHTPVKMSRGKISLGHAEAFGNAIGTITALAQEGNQLKALAALWKKERPEDIQLLRQMYADGKPPQVSWEISYQESEQEGDVEVLRSTSLNGIAVVGMPAYAGRTPIYAMASKENQEDGTLEELETIKAALAEKETEIESLKARNAELEGTQEELTQLREYKAGIELERANAAKLVEIRQKFSEAGIEKDDKYFEDNKDLLLGMNESALSFLVQEMAAFAERAKSDKTSVSATVPPITGGDVEIDLSDPKKLGEALRKQLATKK